MPYQPHRVRDAARAGGSTVVFLPFRSPKLNPCEDLRRGLKFEIAANRCYPSIEATTNRAVA
jgi:transposase